MTSTIPRHDEEQIRRMMGDRQAAMRSSDAEALISRYAEGAVKFDLAPPLQHTGAAVHDVEGLRRWFAGFDAELDYEIRDLAVTVGGDVGFCHSLNRLCATPGGAEQPFELWFRSTVCFRKIGGSWQIAHEHNSTPFYMDGSLRAALDLKP
jgi:ketosteroid isomerase-like protein